MRHPVGYGQFSKVTRSGAILSGVSVFALMLFIVTDVVLRNLGSPSIPGAFEIAENYLLPLIVFPSLAWVYASGIMPHMDLMIPRLSGASRRRMVQTIVALEIVVIGVVCLASAAHGIWHVVHQSAFLAGLQLLPQWPVQLLAPLGFALLLVECCYVFAANRTREEPSFTVAGRKPGPVDDA